MCAQFDKNIIYYIIIISLLQADVIQDGSQYKWHHKYSYLDPPRTQNKTLTDGNGGVNIYISLYLVHVLVAVLKWDSDIFIYEGKQPTPGTYEALCMQITIVCTPFVIIVF